MFYIYPVLYTCFVYSIQTQQIYACITMNWHDLHIENILSYGVLLL